jgi:putative phosphoribosyl transferase
MEATDWLQREPSMRGLLIGLFGASMGGGAALVAAARQPSMIQAVVSRGGRPDLAGPALPEVKAPTLLIVGGADHEVIRLNQHALGQLLCEKQLAIVPGATHLFEEQGALERVSDMALQWFRRYLRPGGPQLEPEHELG